MEVSGGALIVPRKAYVEVGGREYVIPARPAQDWMLLLLEDDWADIVPGLCEGDLAALDEDLVVGRVTTADCEHAAKDVVTAVAGCNWWTAVRLIHSAAADPAAFGELRAGGLDLSVAPLGAALVTLYRIYTKDHDRKDVAKIDAELARPPEGVSAVESRYNADAAAAAFEAQFARRNRT